MSWQNRQFHSFFGVPWSTFDFCSRNFVLMQFSLLLHFWPQAQEKRIFMLCLCFSLWLCTALKFLSISFLIFLLPHFAGLRLLNGLSVNGHSEQKCIVTLTTPRKSRKREREREEKNVKFWYYYFFIAFSFLSVTFYFELSHSFHEHTHIPPRSGYIIHLRLNFFMEFSFWSFLNLNPLVDCSVLFLTPHPINNNISMKNRFAILWFR